MRTARRRAPGPSRCSTRPSSRASGWAEAGFTATVYLQTATLVGLLCGGVAADWLYRRTRAARLWLVCLGLLLSAPCVHLIGSSGSLALTKLAAVGFGLGSGIVIAN